MATKKSYYRRASKSIAGIIAAAAIVVILIAGGIVFGPRLVHHCDNCDKLFVGTGYYANVLSDAWSTISGEDQKILCRDCAEKEHAIALLAGKDLDDFKRPLFENKEGE